LRVIHELWRVVRRPHLGRQRAADHPLIVLDRAHFGSWANYRYRAESGEYVIGRTFQEVSQAWQALDELDQVLIGPGKECLLGIFMLTPHRLEIDFRLRIVELIPAPST
jgi:hypothetical protein